MMKEAAEILAKHIKLPEKSGPSNEVLCSIWKKIFQSSKSTEEINLISKLLQTFYQKYPTLRNTCVAPLDSVLINFSNQNIDVEQRFDASIPIIALSPFYSDENILLMYKSFIELLSAFTSDINDLPLESLPSFSIKGVYNKETVHKICKIIRDSIGSEYQASAALVYIIIYAQIINVVDDIELLLNELLSALFKGDEINQIVGFQIAKHVLDNNGGVHFDRDVFLQIVNLIISPDITISDLAYGTTRTLLSAGYYRNVQTVELIWKMRPLIDIEIINRIYSLMTALCDQENVDELLLRSVAERAHKALIAKSTDPIELPYVFMVLSTIGATSEDTLRDFYKDGIRIAFHLVSQDEVQSFPAICAYLYSISGIVGEHGAEKIARMIPRIVSVAQTKRITVPQKIIVGRALSLLVGRTGNRLFSLDVSSLAEYMVGHSNSDASVCGAEMLVNLGRMVYPGKVPDIASTLLGIVETDEDQRVAAAMLEALRSLVRHFDFAAAAFDQIAPLIIDSALPCLHGSEITHAPVPLKAALSLLADVADRVPEASRAFASGVASLLGKATPPTCCFIAGAAAACLRARSFSADEARALVDPVLALLEELRMDDPKATSHCLEIVWRVMTTSSKLDFVRIGEDVNDVVVMFDNPAIEEPLRGLPYAALILFKIAVDYPADPGVGDSVLLTLIDELPFDSDLMLMDQAMVFVCRLVDSPTRFGKARKMVFRKIADVLLLPDKDFFRYGYKNSTIDALHERLQLECRINGYVKCGLEETYAANSTTIPFDDLLK